MPTDPIPAEVLTAALKIHADVMGTIGCCDGVPEAVAYAYAAGRQSATGRVYTNPRACCSICGKELGVSKEGLVFRHPSQTGFGWCSGSRELPQAEAVADVV